VPYVTYRTDEAKASIVVPLLGQRDDWLEQCVLSALNQSVPCEVLVVRSPRTPARNLATLERLGQDRLRSILQERVGFPAAINDGFRSASCDRIGLLLSDDWLKPDAVERCLEHGEDIVSTGMTCFAANGVDEYASLSWDHDRAVYERLPTLESKACYLSHFFLFQAARIREAGGLDETIGDAPGIDDYDFVWTLLEHRASVAVVERRLYCYRDHDGQRLTLGDPVEQVRNLIRILDKHGLQGVEREAVLRSHSVWYGKAMHRVSVAERAAAGG
jgi:glycosyltransferase involved in cell wall biosynthesis